MTAPGLEAVCAAELATLGIAGEGEVQTGGVAWQGDLRSLYRANLELRTASRVIVRVGGFRARTFAELERRSARLPWSSLIRPGAEVVLRVTSRKSKLYHSDAVAERVMRVLVDACGARDAGRLRGEEEEDADVAGAQLVVVRLLRDEVLLSVDASGVLLHQRGYRQAVAKAPLRETLAAAMLQVAGWRGGVPLADPLCGSGTIPIEAALVARDIAPGLARPGYLPRMFALQGWPGFDEAVWDDVVAAARRRIRDVAGVPITGSDRNAGAISASVANAARAGVQDDVAFDVRPLSAFVAGAPGGHIVTNPPYGVRVGDAATLRGLYVELGRAVAAAGPAWSLTMLSADPRLDAAVGARLEERVRTRNGGIAVRMLTG